MPHFVILEHDFPEQHWDFMLEEGDHLRTWKLLHDPQIQLANLNEKAEISIIAQACADYRLVYLDYEGPISGGRGSVRRAETGTFEYIKEEAQEILINLQGQKIKGILKLVWTEKATQKISLTAESQ